MFSQYLFQINSLPRDDEFAALMQQVHKRNIPGHNYRGYLVKEENGNVTKEIGVSKILNGEVRSSNCQWVTFD